MAAAAAAARRQKAWEDQLVEEAFLNATINPIVDRVVQVKPAMPYALRQMERLMQRTIYLQDNAYGAGGAPGAADPMAVFTYANWDQWTQLAAANGPERMEGLTQYVEALTWSAFVSEFGTDDERNAARITENGQLAFVHLENYRQLDEVRLQTMAKCTTAFNTLKRGAGGAAGAPAAAMRAEKPEKLGSDMNQMELVEELKTRRNGEDMTWDGFKHAIANYPGLKTKFNNYLNKNESVPVWKAKNQPEQVKDFIDEFLATQDDPNIRAIESCGRALKFRQKSNLPTGRYLEMKEMRFDEAIREGNTRGFLDPRMATEAERCRNAVELLHEPIKAAVDNHLCEVHLMGIPLVGYAMDHFTVWAVMVKQVRRLAVQKKLDPAPKSAASPYGRALMNAQSDSESEAEKDRDQARNRDRDRPKPWRRREEARSASDAPPQRGGPMPCYKLPNQKVFKEGDGLIMPVRRPGGPPNNFCVYFWHFGDHGKKGCQKGKKCIYMHVLKSEHDKDPSGYADGKKPAAEQAAAAAQAADSGGFEAKFDSLFKVMKEVAAAQQETSAAVEQFKKDQAAVEIQKKKASEERKARHAAQALAVMPPAASSDASFKLWETASQELLLTQLDSGDES